MSVRSDVLLWAQRIVNKGSSAAPTHLLEVREAATLEEIQAAFHKVAKIAHPDMHRTSLNPEELELVTIAYSRVAGAYQDLRTQRMQTGRIGIRRIGTPPGQTPVAKPGEPAASATGGAQGQMTAKALVYFRKAELSLKRGDLKGAVLQLKMAIAADPLSQMLRAALTEVESELAKG